MSRLCNRLVGMIFVSFIIFVQDKEKSGGRLQSLANFFHNLGPNRRAKSGDGTSIAGESRVHTHSPTSSTVSGSRPVSNTLPPIATESKGRLTVDTPSPRSLSPRTPSPRPGRLSLYYVAYSKHMVQ